MQLPILFDPIYSQLNLAKRHRFPIEKYLSLFQRTIQIYGDQVKPYEVPGFVDLDAVRSVHHPDYIEQFLKGNIDAKAMKRIGFEWSQQFVNRTLTAVNGTLQAAKIAHQCGIAVNLTGGYHHAHPDFGSGFCVFNDLAIAATYLIEHHLAERVLIFDCDVHQGDGTAVCCQEQPQVHTVSIHCEKNFPSRKQHSDWDIGLLKHISDNEYLNVVEETLHASIQSTRADFIIYDAGVDIHIDDDLGLLNVSTDAIAARDLFVFSQAKKLNIPIMAVIGGGYQRDIAALTEVHLQLIHAAVQVFGATDNC